METACYINCIGCFDSQTILETPTKGVLMSEGKSCQCLVRTSVTVNISDADVLIHDLPSSLCLF